MRVLGFEEIDVPGADFEVLYARLHMDQLANGDVICPEAKQVVHCRVVLLLEGDVDVLVGGVIKADQPLLHEFHHCCSGETLGSGAETPSVIPIHGTFDIARHSMGDGSGSRAQAKLSSIAIYVTEGETLTKDA